MTSEARSFLTIRFARLGDVILLLPTLVRLKELFPESRLTLLTGHRCAPIAQMCPAIDNVIAVDRLGMRDRGLSTAIPEMFRLISSVRANRFDCVIDFHSFRETNLLAWLSGAPVRVGLKRFDRAYLSFCFNRPPVVEDKRVHVAEMFQRVLDGVAGATGPSGKLPPVLIVPEALGGWLRSVVPASDPGVALYISAAARDRVWPAEHFTALADYAIQELGASVNVLAGPGEAALARRVCDAVKDRGRVRPFADLTLPQLAGLISVSRVLVSNDTGPMHIGPAMGIPTLGLFSVGLPEHYRPYGKGGRYLKGDPIDTISVESVRSELRGMLYDC